jgi:hypothetical protein
MGNQLVNECLRKCNKLIHLTERNSDIPAMFFSGSTADALKEQRKMQLHRLKNVSNKLKSLK